MPEFPKIDPEEVSPEISGSEIDELTEKEKQTLKKFGGKMIFTPGDFVLSSTKIINEKEINLKYDKLKNLMDVNNYTFDKIINVIKSFKNIRIHIIGDLIIDTHNECEAVAGLHKTPTLSLIKKESISYLGGAGIVAAHFASFSNNVTLTTVLNNDKIGKLAKRMLKKYKVKLNPIYEYDRPTTEKSIYISKSHNLLKVNTLSNHPITSTSLDNIIQKLKKNDYDILIIADYRHGIFNNQSSKVIIKSIYFRF